MKSKEERLQNLNEEDFYFIFLDGTLMPNNSHYIKITMFEDTFFVRDEKEEKENYRDMYFILKVKKLIEDNLENIEKMSSSKSSPIKSSYKHEFSLKINNKTYRVNRNICGEEEKKLYDEFRTKLYEELDVNKISSNNKNTLVKDINKWKQDNKNLEIFKKMIEKIRNYVFYCPVKENNGTTEIAIIKNSRNQRLMTAFSNMAELKKWIKEEKSEVRKFDFIQYMNIFFADESGIDGIVIDPFGVNLVLDRKIIKDISQLK